MTLSDVLQFPLSGYMNPEGTSWADECEARFQQALKEAEARGRALGFEAGKMLGRRQGLEEAAKWCDVSGPASFQCTCRDRVKRLLSYADSQLSKCNSEEKKS